ncbi:MAG: hypothetical protein HY661_05150, partial [Betaproteobacteria bacterium]|nr:hypothetical protein [Betaproteobacteria bacterium]
MQNFKRTSSAIYCLLTAAFLTACGGGGGGGDGTTPVAGTSTLGTGGGTSVSQGVITGFGSVFVNGIEFSTGGATVKIDDNPGLESDLKIGMVVTVRGTADDAARTGSAVQIEARDILEGTIEPGGVDAVNKTITVMGQTVRIEDNVTRLNDDDTVKTFATAAFAVGDRVEVHGFADDQGGLRATRVAKKASGEFEIKGFVTSIGAGTFGLSLTPGGAVALTVTGTLPAGAIVGSLVEVKAGAAPLAGTLTATAVQLEDRLGAAGEKVEVEGIVTSGTVDSFLVNGQRVLTNSATLFEGGLRTDFAVGAKLEAEGPMDANGAIAATKISFRGNIKIEANASGVSASGLTVLGKSVAINAFTRVDNGPLADGQHVEVRAFADRDGNLIATRV